MVESAENLRYSRKSISFITDKPGLACCAEAKTGKVLWSERLFEKEDVMLGHGVSEPDRVSQFDRHSQINHDVDGRSK